MRAQRKTASAKAGNSADQMKQFAEFFARFVNEHGYGAWVELLDEFHKESGAKEDLENA